MIKRDGNLLLVSPPTTGKDCVCSIETRGRVFSMDSKPLGRCILDKPLGNVLLLHDGLWRKSTSR